MCVSYDSFFSCLHGLFDSAFVVSSLFAVHFFRLPVFIPICSSYLPVVLSAFLLLCKSTCFLGLIVVNLSISSFFLSFFDTSVSLVILAVRFLLCMFFSHADDHKTKWRSA